MQVVQSYKKVLNFAPTSQSASTKITKVLSSGTDSTAAGQTGPTDGAVPTGSIIRFFDIQYVVENVGSTGLFQSITMQRMHTGQPTVDPLVVGGNPARNQVHLQLLKSIGKDQNGNFHIKFRVPKKFQRVREGDTWVLVTSGDAVHSDNCLVIYKFYR